MFYLSRERRNILLYLALLALWLFGSLAMVSTPVVARTTRPMIPERLGTFALQKLALPFYAYLAHPTWHGFTKPAIEIWEGRGGSFPFPRPNPMHVQNKDSLFDVKKSPHCFVAP